MLNLNQPQGSVGTSPQLDGTGLTNPANWQNLLGVASLLDSRRRSFAGGQPGISCPGNIGSPCWIPVPLSGQVLGTGDFTVWVRFRLSTASGTGVFSITDPGNNWFGLVTASTYTFDKSIAGVTSNTVLTGMGAAQAGQVVDFVVTRAAGVLTYYLNGAQLGNTDATAGWNWTSSAVFKVGGYFTSGQNYNDRIYRAVLFNRALSAQDVADLVINGVADADQWGTQTPIVSGATLNGDFEAWTVAGTAGTSNGTATSWSISSSGVGNTVTRNGTSPIGGTYDAMFTMGANSGFAYVLPTLVNTVVGKRYRAKISAKRISGAGNLTISGAITNTAIKTITLATGSVVDDSTEYIADSARPYWNTAAANTVIQVDNAVIERIGALVDLNLGEGAGLCFTDRSTNNLHGCAIGGSAGIGHVVPGREGCVRVRTTAGGGIQLGGSNPVIPLNARIRCITADAVSGTPMVTMGSASGGTQHVASVALTAGLNDLTVVNRFNATGNLWVNVSVTATVDWTVVYDLVD